MRNKTVILFTVMTTLFAMASSPPTFYTRSGTWGGSTGRNESFEIIGDETIEFGGPWHRRVLVVFVRPQKLTSDNVEKIFLLLSREHPDEDRLDIYGSGDPEESQCAAEWIKHLKNWRQKAECWQQRVEAPRPYAIYHRSDMFEGFSFYPSEGGSIQRDLYAPDDPCSSSTDQAVNLIASSSFCPEHVKELLDDGVDPNVKSRYGGSALVNASHSGNEEAVNLLLERGAFVNQTSSAGWTPLITAIYRQHPRIVNLLLEQGADVNMSTEHGRTALMTAVLREDIDSIKKLLANGASVLAVDDEGRTAADIAKQIGHEELARIIESFRKE